MKRMSGQPISTQNGSRAIYDCYGGIHGLTYPSSLTNHPVIALYERALEVKPFPATPRFHRVLDDPLLPETVRNACWRSALTLFEDFSYKLPRCMVIPEVNNEQGRVEP
jgi:hypothetical protein